MESEVALRLGSFLSGLLIVALIEHLRPKRKLKINKATRWARNLSLVVIDSVLVRILIPFTAASTSIYAEQNQIGLLHALSFPLVVSAVISVLLLDFIIYWQHRAFHAIPILWRPHKVHHIDQEIDVTTGIRFHPVEIILSALIKCSAVLLLGAPFVAVVIFEILLNATSLFNHGNINLPAKLDKFLRVFIVTPDMHRVHHSVIVQETNSNFGFNLTWWDKLFYTYKAQPANGHLNMEIGLKDYRDPGKTSLPELLIIPFRNKNSD